MARWKARSIRLESSLLGSTRRLVARSGRNRSKCAERLRVIFSRLNAANCNRVARCAVTSKHRDSWLTRMRHFSAVRESRQRSNPSRLGFYRRLRGSPRITGFWSAGHLSSVFAYRSLWHLSCHNSAFENGLSISFSDFGCRRSCAGNS